MSEMTRCNFCRYMALVARAHVEDKAITLTDSTFMGGTEVYLHPKGTLIVDMSEEERKQYHTAWFMSLPTHCCC
jgi:hypothetical protein